jgi:hypothetical protein
VSRLARAVVVALATATVVLPVGGLGATSATAATCAAGGGVSVVVDFNSLGGGVQTSCVAGGGGDKASAIFGAAGHTLGRVQQQPGFVCRVDGLPSPEQEACVKTPPADAYWGLWWSNGTSGSWTYSTVGVDGLTIPDGGSVALSWDDVDGSAPPSATPPKAAASSPSSAPASSPAASPTKKAPSAGGGGTSGSPASGSSSSAEASSSATAGPSATSTTDESATERKRARKGRDSGEATAGATPTGSATPEDEPSADTAAERRTTEAAATEADGLPVWVAPVALLVLAAGGGAAVWLRRRAIP